jgi:hypothetical protein
MRLAIRGASCVLVIALIAGCGGDSNDPGEAFPDASGVYEVTGGFDDFPSSQASFTGTLEFTQASRESGALEGSAAMLANLGGDIFNLTDDALSNATVSPSGVITFTMAGGSSTWTFSGTLSGNNISQGRHTLSGGESFSGSWQATRATGDRVADRTVAPTLSLDALLVRLRR